MMRARGILQTCAAGMLLLAALLGCQARSPGKGNPMLFATVVVGPLGVNCTILGCPETREGVVIDPGADVGLILAKVKEMGLTITQVINTHGHFDHVGGNREVLAATGARLLIHQADLPLLSRAVASAAMYGLTAENSPDPHEFLSDGQIIRFGKQELQVLHTPGHTPGGCCLYHQASGQVITGDTLFADGVGRTDFPGSSSADLVAGIKAKLFTLPDATVAYPGHGPSTTIGHEKRHNPYVY
jgi:glyoxylase-like metal-dependent hydrolase (beta-lactamase superfamily II)